ncbi:right-handed parallel beta-helix repeat-containing protein [Streptomyces sp. NPDC090025]|uniref:right-handed parallel beta-helix repeat-containing protein n=1 Tax=Streptomyces sp. NPDC090025 TaxID=3365922 RepID=UPI003834DCD3
MAVRYRVSPRGGMGVHRDIASALAAAARRGRPARVEIGPGRYPELLVVRGEVELVGTGEPGSVVVGRPGGVVCETAGAVQLRGLVVVAQDADAVHCRTGTLTLDRTEVRAPGAAAVHAWPGTAATLRDSVFRFGRVAIVGADGLVERCVFEDAADNCLAAVDGGRLVATDSRFARSRLHAVRINHGRGEVVRCAVTGTGGAALIADGGSELTVADCAVDGVNREAIAFTERSHGSVDRTRVTDAEHGIAVNDGSDALVRDSSFVRCRDTGINVRTAGRGRYENCEVADAGNVAVFVTDGGAPELHGGRIADGNVGIVVSGNRSRGRFTGVRVEDMTGVGLRAYEGGKAVFEQVIVERCATHLETRGDAGTTAEVRGGRFVDFSLSAVEALGQSRVTLRDVTAERGMVGFAVAEQAQLFVHDCVARDLTSSGAAAMGKGRLVARNLTVTGSEAIGLMGSETGVLDVRDSEFTDCAAVGVLVVGDSVARLVDCGVSGTGEAAVHHSGHVDLVGLRTELPVTRMKKENHPTPTIVNQYGPVFNGVAQGIQIAYGNHGPVEQHQHHHHHQQAPRPRPGSRPGPGSRPWTDEDGSSHG